MKLLNFFQKIDLFIIAISLYVVTVSVNLQVPLYSTYAQANDRGNVFTAIVFAAYIGGLLFILTFLGGASDYFGRKPVIIGGLIASFLATFLVSLFPNIKILLISRIFQGIGVGLCVGSATAYLSENMEKSESNKAPYFASLTTSFGFATGALFTSLSLLYKFSLVPISYWIILSLNFLCLIIVFLKVKKPTFVKSKNITRLPIFLKGTIIFDIAIMLAWSVTGIIISMVSLELANSNLSQWIGVVLFSAIGTGTFIQPLARKFQPYKSVKIGSLLILFGYTFLLIGIYFSSVILIILGSIIAGSSCYGFTYLGGLAAINSAANDDEISRAVSGFFLFAYIGFSVPSIIVGFISDFIGINYSLSLFGIVVLFSTIILSYSLEKQSKLSRI